MPVITLTDAEAAALQEALLNYVSDLRMEISNTEERRFRDELKYRETALNRILAALSSEPPGRQPSPTT